MENYIARIHLWIEGKYDTICSELIANKVIQQPVPYSQKAADRYLNSEIEHAVIYKDSVGLVFRREINASDSYAIGIANLENGKWLGRGEDICFAKNMNEAKQYIEDHSVSAINRLRKFEQLKAVSTDTVSFKDYLKCNGQKPVHYLIDKLSNHKLVIYGEVHFRKNSWELLLQLIQLPEFSESTGAVFLELSKNAQPELDKFFKNKTKDQNIILNIFRKEEINGWNDRGMYDFLLKLWDVNHKLENKINVIATDMPRIFYQNITNREQYDSIYRATCDRNEIMTETILNTINNSSDKRNNLFIVGWGHAYKSPSLHRTGLQINGLSVGFLLSDKIGKENVFSIFTHSPETNNVFFLSKLRKGLFDYVFEENGNIPVAFDLKNSPFGKELYDADTNIKFDIKTGTFADNFDGYIFLQSLQEEVNNTPLYELFTDDFVEEIKRRVRIVGDEDIFNISIDSLTKEKIYEILDANFKENNNKRYPMFDNK